MAEPPILYSFRRCPYAVRARMALAVSGAVCAIREVVLADKPAEMIAASPKATVPVLVLSDRVIDESLDIMRWALARNDPEDWLGGDDAALIAAFDGDFKRHLDRYKYPEGDAIDPAEARAEGMTMLADLEARLVRHANLCRDSRALADIAILPFVRQFAEVDRAWFDGQPLPQVRRWLAEHLASPLFARIMVKLPPWRAADSVTLFPA